MLGEIERLMQEVRVRNSIAHDLRPLTRLLAGLGVHVAARSSEEYIVAMEDAAIETRPSCKRFSAAAHIQVRSGARALGFTSVDPAGRRGRCGIL